MPYVRILVDSQTFVAIRLRAHPLHAIVYIRCLWCRIVFCGIGKIIVDNVSISAPTYWLIFLKADGG